MRTIVRDMIVPAAAGFAGTKVMEPVVNRLYERESEQAREREDPVRPDPPFQIAAEKTARRLGLELEQGALERAGMAMHYALPMAWAATYPVLRRFMSPLMAGLISGLAMGAIVDEGLTPAPCWRI